MLEAVVAKRAKPPAKTKSQRRVQRLAETGDRGGRRQCIQWRVEQFFIANDLFQIRRRENVAC